jgi:hypothetical protein
VGCSPSLSSFSLPAVHVMVNMWEKRAGGELLEPTWVWPWLSKFCHVWLLICPGKDTKLHTQNEKARVPLSGNYKYSRQHIQKQSAQ